MAKQPTFREFVVTVLKRSAATWHGSEGWFALATYFTVLILPFLVSGVVEDILGDVFNRLLALAATGWIVALFIIITPFRMWREERYRMNLVEEASRPKIHVGWNFNERKKAEVILTNYSSKTLEGIEVMFRNYRQADGTGITPSLVSLTSVDGKQPPISLNPLVPHYFEFAELKRAENGKGAIAILSGTDKEVWLGQEAGVKLGISGKDLGGSKIEFRLKVQDDGSIGIEPWDVGKNAVSAEDPANE